MNEQQPPVSTHENRSAGGFGSAPDVLAPLLSTAIFGYYGFLSGTTADTTDADGNTVPLWIASLWILRLATILFLGSTIVAVMRTQRATLIHGLAGGLATLGLATILIWDQLEPAYDFACPPLILLVFIVWNGFTSFLTVREALGPRAG
ncbi:MAG: hypothetical protein RLY21_1735 [Planctomycetota bacterium]|jgi:hypothetical protein